MNTNQISDEDLQQHYILLNSERFDMICTATYKRLEKIENNFVKELLDTCWKARRITFKQFKVLWNFNSNVVPEYRDFN